MKLFTSVRSRIRSSLSIQFFLIILAPIFLLIGLGAWLTHDFIISSFPEMAEKWHTLFDANLILGSMLICILISVIVYSALSTLVIQPLNSLVQLWRKENPAAGENEIKQLSTRLTRMDNDLNTSVGELAEQQRKMEAIITFKFNLNDPPSLEKFFQDSLGTVQKLTGYYEIRMRLYDPETQSFRLMAQSGLSNALQKELASIHSNTGFHAELFQTHQPTFTSNLANDQRRMSSQVVKEGYQSLVCIPMLALDDLVGSIQIALKEEHDWGADELRWLALVGRRIGLLVRQIQLSERLRNMAVLEERSRIAQEIHDGLAQRITAMRMWSDQALNSLEENDIRTARQNLYKIEASARDAFTDLREEMLGLRTKLSPDHDLAASISIYLNRFQREWGIRTQLQVDKTAQKLPLYRITPAVEIQLIRILQEALTNVRRHADASLIEVNISTRGDRLLVKVQDDGRGFDPNQIPEGHLGQRIMHERAASVEATVAIFSKEGAGTMLVIELPLQPSHATQAGEP